MQSLSPLCAREEQHAAKSGQSEEKLGIINEMRRESTGALSKPRNEYYRK